MINLIKWAGSFLAAALFIAILIQAIGKNPEMPKTISTAFAALTNIFKGAYS